VSGANQSPRSLLASLVAVLVPLPLRVDAVEDGSPAFLHAVEGPHVPLEAPPVHGGVEDDLGEEHEEQGPCEGAAEKRHGVGCPSTGAVSPMLTTEVAVSDLRRVGRNNH